MQLKIKWEGIRIFVTIVSALREKEFNALQVLVLLFNLNPLLVVQFLDNLGVSSVLGCHIHRGNPKLWRTGNPRMSLAIKNASLSSKKAAAGYRAQGDSPLAPWELLNFRNTFVNSNDMWDLQIYVMTILTVKQAFRESECETIKIESFEPDLFIFNNDNIIVSLCVTVMVDLKLFFFNIY
jgi:hypothetical protein